MAGRYTLLEQTPLDELFQACEDVGTSIICGGPFNSGVLVGREMWNYKKAPKHLVRKVLDLSSIAKKYGIPLPAAALQFPLFNPIISAVIPGAKTKAKVEQILTWFSTDIPIKF